MLLLLECKAEEEAEKEGKHFETVELPPQKKDQLNLGDSKGADMSFAASFFSHTFKKRTFCVVI